MNPLKSNLKINFTKIFDLHVNKCTVSGIYIQIILKKNSPYHQKSHPYPHPLSKYLKF